MSSADAYRDDLDTLRALAVGLVLVFHFSLIPGMKGGFLGVDVFFVISGYIITRKQLPVALAGQFRLASFWTARVRRLAPALLVTLALTLLAGWLYYLPAQLESLATQALATQAYVANVYYWRTVNYFGLQAKLVPLLHTWSLAVEEQFYLFYPLLLLAAARLKAVAFAVCVAAVTVLSFLACVWLVSAKPEATFYLAPTRIWELGVGCALAIVEWHRRQQPWGFSPAVTHGLFLLGLAVAVGSAGLYHPGLTTPGFYSLLPVAATALMIGVGAHISGLLRTVWLNGVLRYLGRISYPLYLTHWPINVFAKDMLNDSYTWGWRLGALGLSVVSAAAIHEWVEKPIARRRAMRLRQVLLPYGLATAVLCAVCVGIWMGKGVPQRFAPEVLTLASGEQDRAASLEHCIPKPEDRTKALADPGCRLGDLNQPETVLLLGDSHAWVTAPALSAVLKAQGLGGRIVFHHACPPLMGVHLQDGGRDLCQRHNAATFEWALAQPGIRRVVLVSTWIQGQSSLTDDPMVSPTASRSPALFAQSLAKTVDALKAAGKQVYVMGPIPGARLSVPQTLARNAAAGRPLERGLVFTTAEHRARHAYFAPAVAAVQGRLDGFFDPATVLCPGEVCQVQRDGRALYFDSDHISLTAARLLEPGLAAMLAGGHTR
jgi:peptidoglycan/LPS O-acetylase OafA/YrhL